ncbi:MAG: hypothetical protein ASARMPRED_002140 [Alectoria sarmentosa]|nr:MAG: hypothetical protein ASARMPRED_002140 [Alectoria sarmentosa]
MCSTLPNVEPDANFDCYLHGSIEHLDALRELHTYHEGRKEHLRSKHGQLYDEFELVKSELDTLADELLHLSDHGVALNANFTKFGYDAHIRTKDPDSSTSSLSGDRSSSHRDWEAERRNGQALKFYKKPTIRQYWHRGLLWRASEVEEVASFELFVDLLYVGIISVIGDTAAENATGLSLLKFTITFALAFKMWTDLTLIVSWFAINIEHKTERTNAFVTLVFGYSVVALLFQNKAAYGINAFFGKAVLGLIQAFSFNWLYFEIDSWNLHTHAIRRHFVSYKEFDGERIKKRYRIIVRASVAIIIIFLPLADSLSSLKLVSITTGLTVLTLIVDVYGSTSIHDDFWKCTTQCGYRANCPIKRKLAMDAVKTGTTIRLEEVQFGNGGEKAYYDVRLI